MPSESERKPLPFEPKRNRQKPEKRSPQVTSSSKSTSKATAKNSTPQAKAQSVQKTPKDGHSTTAKDSRKRQSPAASREQIQIPEVVSRRMVRRMAVFCGIPTFLGMSSFFASYFIVKNDLFPLPHVAVVLVSMALFGMGVVGLSYGALSASWDEEKPGSRLGVSEFGTNWQRMTQAWRSSRKSS